MKTAEGNGSLLTSMRFRICLLLLGAYTASTCMRSHFSMTLVCMLKKRVSNSTEISTNITVSDNGCPNYNVESDGVKVETETGELEWSREMTPYLFTVLLLGQVASLLISMHLSSRIAPTKMLLFSVLSQVLITMISPTLARISYWAFFVSRLALGVAEGLIASPGAAIATRWFPPNERASMAAVYTSANQISNGIAPFIVSFICSFQLDWTFAFYLFGLLGLVWAAEWLRVGSDDPLRSKRMSEKEKEQLSVFQTQGLNKAVVRPPYGKMFTSPVLFAHLAAVAAFYSTTTIMASFLPTFFEERMGLPIRKNGLYTMIPFVAQIFAKNGLAFGLDSLKKSGSIGHTAAAKIAQTMGCVGSSTFLLMLIFFADCRRPEVALLAMTLCLSLHSCMAVGFYASMMLICPPLTGVIVPIVIAAGVTASGLSTAVMGVAADYSYKYELIFGLCITLNVFAGIIYLVWGTAEVQPWASHFNIVTQEERKQDMLLDEEGDEKTKEILSIPMDTILKSSK